MGVLAGYRLKRVFLFVDLTTQQLTISSLKAIRLIYSC
jgi:hypothetical protein